MRGIWLAIGLTAGVLVLVLQPLPSGPEARAGSAPPGQAQDKVAAKPATDRSADEAAIRANVEAFVKAYNAGDAKAVAAFFTADGQTVDKDGDTTEGRAAIEAEFKKLFTERPKKRLEVFIESIRFLGADMAVEVGTTKETPAPGEAPEYDKYTALHVKRDGKWQMALVKESEGDPPTCHERLLPLGWLVGEWVDDDGNVVVNSTCRWADGGNFLLLEFKLQVGGKDEMHVSQRIGWDPLAKCVRSWVFDSEGGYGESVWARDGDQWIIKATGVRADGTTASATNMLVPAGKDGYVWRSRDRVIDNEAKPDVEVKIVRKPPPPKPGKP